MVECGFKNGIITIDRAVTIKPQYNIDGTKGERISVVETTKTVAGIRKIKDVQAIDRNA